MFIWQRIKVDLGIDDESSEDEDDNVYEPPKKKQRLSESKKKETHNKSENESLYEKLFGKYNGGKEYLVLDIVAMGF